MDDLNYLVIMMQRNTGEKKSEWAAHSDLNNADRKFDQRMISIFAVSLALNVY